MRVGIYIPHFSPKSGGAYSFQNTIIKSLQETMTDHEFYIFYSGQQFKKEHSSIKFIPVSIDNPNKTALVKLLLRMRKNIFLKKLFKKEKVLKLNEAVLENHIELIWFITPFYEYVEIPFIITVWDLQHRFQPFFPEVSVSGWSWESRENLYKSILPRAAFVITGTEEGKREISFFYGISERRIKIIPLPTPEFINNPVITDSENVELKKLTNPILFYPAQFWPHKNHIALLFAYKILKEKYNLLFDLVFVGSDTGNLSYIENIIEDLGLQENVHNFGFISFNDMIFLYKNSFALVFPSLFGPDNLPPLEAMGLGCPVVISDQPGIEEQLGDAALIIDTTNENVIVEAILKLKNDETLRTELIQRGYKRANSFKSEDYIRMMINIIDEFKPYRRCWSSNDKYIHL